MSLNFSSRFFRDKFRSSQGNNRFIKRHSNNQPVLLTAIALPLNPERPTISPIQISNSVMSWLQIITVSPDGRFVYVAEVRSHPADRIQEFSTIDEMLDGEAITIVDIKDLQQLKIMQAIKVSKNPKHVSICPNGKL